jgi:peptidoglycan/LPS O-acetylase OafA/YrhL
MYLALSLILPLAGVLLGALAIWKSHQRESRALDVLKIYAERGAEPPEGVLEALLNRRRRPRGSEWALFALYATLAAGFGLTALYTFLRHHRGEWGLGLPGLIFLALAISSYVQAVRGRRDDR